MSVREDRLNERITWYRPAVTVWLKNNVRQAVK